MENFNRDSILPSRRRESEIFLKVKSKLGFEGCPGLSLLGRMGRAKKPA